MIQDQTEIDNVFYSLISEVTRHRCSNSHYLQGSGWEGTILLRENWRQEWGFIMKADNTLSFIVMFEKWEQESKVARIKFLIVSLKQ